MTEPEQEPKKKDRAYWRERSLDLFVFETVICKQAWPDKFHNFGKIHKRMCDYLDTRITPSRKKYLSVFRGSYKTTVLLGYFTWFFCLNLAMKKANSIIYNTATKDNAWNFQADVKHELLTNEFLQWIFPELPKTETAYQTMTKNIIKHRFVKMEFASPETTQVSRHAPVYVNDDMENDDNSKTEYQREDLKRKWKYQKSILTKISSRGIGLEVDVGTPFHNQGLTWYVRNLKSYDKLEIPCYIDGDKNKGVTFPEMYTVQDFEEIREEQGNQIFNSQYLLKPLAEEESLCPEYWIRRWSFLPENRWRTMVIDPGGAEPMSSDATGVTIVDTDENGMMYIVHAEEYFLTPVKLMELINRLKDEFRPDDIRIEKDRYATTIADIMEHRFPLLHVSFVKHERRTKGSAKQQVGTRIWRLRQLFEDKRILVGPGQHNFVHQLTEFPHSKRDDMLDSLAYHLDIRRLPSKRIPHRLPSGKEFEANIEPSFDKELDDFISKRYREEVKDYDSLY